MVDEFGVRSNQIFFMILKIFLPSVENNSDKKYLEVMKNIFR